MLPAPFMPLFHYWPEILQIFGEHKDEGAKKHFQLLQEILEPEFAPLQAARDTYGAIGFIEFDKLWTLFRPGSLIYWEDDGHPNIARLKETPISMEFGQLCFSLDAVQVSYNGKMFGFVRVWRSIDAYKGSHSLNELTMPLDMRPDRAQIIKTVIARGQKFESLQGKHFKAYKHQSTSSGPVRTGRVIIDAAQYYSANNALILSPLKIPEPPSPTAATDPNAPMYYRRPQSHRWPGYNDRSDPVHIVEDNWDRPRKPRKPRRSGYKNDSVDDEGPETIKPLTEEQ